MHISLTTIPLCVTVGQGQFAATTRATPALVPSPCKDAPPDEESQTPDGSQNFAPEADREGHFDNGRRAASKEEGQAIDFRRQRRSEDPKDCPWLEGSTEAVYTRTYR